MVKIRNRASASAFMLPKAPRSIAKGSSLRVLLGPEAVRCLAHNLSLVAPKFDSAGFQSTAIRRVREHELLQRGRELSRVLHEFLPKPYERGVRLLLRTLTPPLERTEQNGLGVFFYLPHICFVSEFGLDPRYNGGKDPFDLSMRAQYELTRRFSAEFSIRPFLIRDQARTLRVLRSWTEDSCPHVRRLCSEGTRPRLPWAVRIPKFIQDPAPVLGILERLKDDPVLYVRRSVANHLGDIAKDHRDLALSICKNWLINASPERRWLIRHALRYLAKKNDREALRLRAAAK